MPTPATTKPITAFFSFLLLATAAKTKPTGPKTIGKNKSYTAPQIMAPIEKEFPGVVGTGDITFTGLAKYLPFSCSRATPHLLQKLLV